MTSSHPPRAGMSTTDLLEAAGARCMDLQREMRRRYPSVLGDLHRIAAVKGSDPDFEWPDDIWLPMAAAHKVVGDAYGGVVPPHLGRDLARVAALSTWDLDKGVFWVTPEVAELVVPALWSGETALDPRIPRERIMTGLPQYCVYVAFPVPAEPRAADLAEAPWGVFIHLEVDQNTRRPEIRFAVDVDGTWDGLSTFLVFADALTLGANVRQQRNTYAPGLDGEDVVEQLRLNSFLVWPALLALVEPGVEHRRVDLPGELVRRVTATRSPGGAIKWPRAKAPSLWSATVADVDTPAPLRSA
ncbi:hypothetical protein [Embleya sp. NPDC005971]|uniref:hypothetical protein n=1 Tax=Embleya sp. NPDC005971 TaxID=3156724 RepID=UPI003408C21B